MGGISPRDEAKGMIADIFVTRGRARFGHISRPRRLQGAREHGGESRLRLSRAAGRCGCAEGGQAMHFCRSFFGASVATARLSGCVRHQNLQSFTELEYVVGASVKP